MKDLTELTLTDLWKEVKEDFAVRMKNLLFKKFVVKF